MKNLRESVLESLKTFSMLRLATIVPSCEEITGIYPDMNLPLKESFESFYNGFDSDSYKEVYGVNPTLDDRWNFCIDCTIANEYKHLIQDACILLDSMQMPQEDLDEINVMDYEAGETRGISRLKNAVWIKKVEIQ